MLVSSSKEESLSKRLYMVKAFAILSVICAHIPFSGNHAPYLEALYARFGTLGAPTFFILSGYFHSFTSPEIKRTFPKYCFRKCQTLLIPWLFSIIVHLCVKYVCGNVMTGKEMLNFALGNGSFYYFISVLVILDLLFSLLHYLPSGCEQRKKQILVICMIANVISIFLAAMGYGVSLDQEKFPFTYWNPYLNIFNWIGFFALGAWMKMKGTLIRIDRTISYKNGFIIAIICVLVFCISSIIDPINWYFGFCSIAVEVCGFLFFFLCTKVIPSFLGRYVSEVGKTTYPIYLYHTLLIPLTGLVGVPQMMKPLVVLFMCVVLLYGVQELSKVIKCHKLFSLLSGYR